MKFSDHPRSIKTAQSADWALSRGVSSWTTAQIAELLAVPVSQVPQRMSAAKSRGEWITPARGLWVPVAPEFRGWGGPPATEFISDLMNHFGISYYIGWLAAASVYGAAHHASQTTHMATSRLVRDRQIGRAQLFFHVRTRVTEIPTVEKMARSGPYLISTPEITALDIASDIAISGGLDNAATVIVDLTDESSLNDQALSSCAPLYSDAAVRRVGWIIEHFTEQRVDVLADYVAHLTSAPSRLHPSLPLAGRIDERWQICINTSVGIE